ncbi:MAG: class IV adenylate cyclase [Thermoprotei archaeon]|nr:MAG: class IV adenylate cyclase [Thermoprotei archaeon]
MKKLVEIKARYKDLDYVRRRLKELNAKHVGVFHQVDTYFLIGDKRLKLREVEGQSYAQLVYYLREDIKGPKVSNVMLVRVLDSDTLKRVLEDILGIKVVVDKIREIYLYKGVQVHLDQVKGLGTFIEFEMNIENRKVDEGKQFLKELMRELGVKESDLIERSYSDLMLRSLEVRTEG